MESYLSADPAYSTSENENNDNSWLVFNNSNATTIDSKLYHQSMANGAVVYERNGVSREEIDAFLDDENAIKIDSASLQEEDLKKILRDNEIDPTMFSSVIAALPTTFSGEEKVNVSYKESEAPVVEQDEDEEEVIEEENFSYDCTLPASYPGFFSHDGEISGTGEPVAYAFVPQLAELHSPSQQQSPRPTAQQQQPPAVKRRRQTPAGRRHPSRKTIDIGGGFEVYEEQDEAFDEAADGAVLFVDEQQQQQILHQQQQQLQKRRQCELKDENERIQMLMMMAMADAASNNLNDDTFAAEADELQRQFSSDSKEQEIGDPFSADAETVVARKGKQQSSQRKTRRSPITVKFDPTNGQVDPRLAARVQHEAAAKQHTKQKHHHNQRFNAHHQNQRQKHLQQRHQQQHDQVVEEPVELATTQSPSTEGFVKRNCIPVPIKKKPSSLKASSNVIEVDIKKALEVSSEIAKSATNKSIKTNYSSTSTKGSRIPQPAEKKSEHAMSRLSCGSKPSRIGLTKSLSAANSKHTDRNPNETIVYESEDYYEEDQDQGGNLSTSHSARLLHSANLAISESISNGGIDPTSGFVNSSGDNNEQQTLNSHSGGYSSVSDDAAELDWSAARPPPPVRSGARLAQSSSTRPNNAALYRSSTVSIISAFSPGRIPDYLFNPPPPAPLPPRPMLSSVRATPATTPGGLRRPGTAGVSILNLSSTPPPYSHHHAISPYAAAQFAPGSPSGIVYGGRIEASNQRVRPLSLVRDQTITGSSMRSILSALSPGRIPSSLYNQPAPAHPPPPPPPPPQLAYRRSSSIAPAALASNNQPPQLALKRLPPRPPSLGHNGVSRAPRTPLVAEVASPVYFDEGVIFTPPPPPDDNDEDIYARASFASILSALAPGPIPDELFSKRQQQQQQQQQLRNSASQPRFNRSKSASNAVMLNKSASLNHQQYQQQQQQQQSPPRSHRSSMVVPSTAVAAPTVVTRSSRIISTAKTSSSLGSVFSKLAPGPIPDELFRRTPPLPPQHHQVFSKSASTRHHSTSNVPVSNKSSAPPSSSSAASSQRNFFLANVISNLQTVPINAPLECFEGAIEAATDKGKLARSSTVPYKCSLVHREINTSVKYVRPVRILSTPYEVAATIFENSGNGQNAKNAVCLPDNASSNSNQLVPHPTSRLIVNAPPQSASNGPETGVVPRNNNVTDLTSTLNKKHHTSLQLPNNMGTISIVIENLKI